jgi:hypothetical protein
MINESQQSWTLQQFFDHYTKLIESKHPFSFVRWGDGELAVAAGHPVGEQSLVNQNKEWVFKEGGRTKLGDALVESLKLQGPDNHYGLPCRCCASQSEHTALIPLITESPVAPNTIFGNANYARFIEWAKTLNDKGISVSLVVNHLAQDNLDKYPFRVNKFCPVPSNCIQEFEKNGDRLVEGVFEFAESFSGHFVMVAAGPMSEVFITEMWKANPRNIYFDVGSSLDVYTKAGVLDISRPHHDPNNHYAHVECRMTGPFARPY